MRRRIFGIALVTAIVVGPAVGGLLVRSGVPGHRGAQPEGGRWTVAYAQEGHPLVGTWHGTWGPNATERHDVTLVLEFDGQAVTGMMNPGPDSVKFDKVTLEPGTWAVHIEATPRGGTNTARIVIDAAIQDITNRYRSIVGTWTQGAAKGDFKATRDS